MAFVYVERLGKRTRVPKKTYETKLKKLGFKLVEEIQEVVNKEVIEDVETENDADTEQDEELETTPVSEMNKEQLIAYAKKHNIDTKGARNVNEARKMIQKAIRDSKM